MSDRQAALAALTRQHLFVMLMRAFAMFHPGQSLQPSWYLEATCHWLEGVALGERPRSMIWIQPRTLKSFTTAVVFPCWVLGRNPSAKIMVAAYGEALSREHAEKRRQIMESDWYKALFPGTRVSESRVLELKTTKGGSCQAVSVGGPVTGRGADLIILDDCMKAEDVTSEAERGNIKNWFSNALSTRLNDKRDGAIVSIQQRLHEDDLPAYLADKGYTCLNLPAVAEEDHLVAIGYKHTYLRKAGELLDPVRFPQEVLDQERLNLGPQAYSAQYLQNPVSPEGNLLRMEQFRVYRTDIPRERFDKVIQSWDTAASELPTSDYTVGTTWGYLAGRVFLLDIYRKRVSYPDLKRAVLAAQHKWQADIVIIENASTGQALLGELIRINRPYQLFSAPMGRLKQRSKEDRLIAQTGQIEEGRVWLPARLDGLDVFRNELRAFPNGRHDDCVDTLTQLLELLMHRWQEFHKRYTPEGRLVDHIRGDRPPLPKLPAWIEGEEEEEGEC